MVELELPFDEAIDQTTEALKEQGFNVLTTSEVDKVLQSRLDVDRDRSVILGVCSPGVANPALDADIDIGLLLPCNAVVREENDRRYATFVNPQAMLTAAGDAPELLRIAKQVRGHLDAVGAALADG